MDDTALRWLYQNCFAFVYPSLFEGFGLPVLEAMSLGAAIIASDTTSIPEIVGSAGLLVDPRDEVSLRAAMERIFIGEAGRDQLRSLAGQRAGQFSWERSAQRVLELYTQTASAQPRQKALGQAEVVSAS